MPLTTEQVFIEFIADPSQLQTTLGILEQSGTIDKKLAESFKATNTQLNAQATALKNVNNNLSPVKKSLEGLAVASKQIGTTFQQEFQKGIIETLKKSGVSIDEFDAKLDSLKSNTAFQSLQTELIKTAARIADTMQKLEAMKSSGAGVGAFKQLEAQLVKDQQELAKLEQDIKDVLKVTVQGDPLDPLEKGSEQAATQVASLRSQLRLMREEIARSIAAGTNYGVEFDALVEKAGRLDDAMKDASKSIANVGSDTRNIEGLISVAQGVAGGFAIAQGAAALFGDESEELQKTLLKVNAAMAILQGLQAVQTTLLKEQSAAQLLNRISTNAAAAAQKAYTVIVGTSTGALKGFRLALAATGIGAIILLLGVLITHWDDVKEAINGVSKAQQDLVDQTKENADAEVTRLDALEEEDVLLKLQGKTEKEILESKIKQIDIAIEARRVSLQAAAETLRSQIDAEKRNREILAGILNFLTIPLNALFTAVNKVAELLGSDLHLPDVGSLAKMVFDEDEVRAEGEKAISAIADQVKDLEQKRAGFQLNLNEELKAANEQRLKDTVSSMEAQLAAVEAGTKKELELQKKLLIAKAALDSNGAKTAAERREIQAKLQQDLLLADAQFEKARLEEKAQAIQNELILAEEGSQEELDLKLKLMDAETAAELKNLELTKAQRDNIEEAHFNNKLKLQREFNKKLTAQALTDDIARNNAALANDKITLEDKQNLTIANIEATAELEVAAAKGNSALIQEIYAKRDAAIRDFKIQAIQDAVDYEIDTQAAVEGAHRRSLARIVADEKSSFDERVQASQELTDIRTGELDKQIKSEQDLLDGNLLKDEESRNAHKLKIKQLEDEKNQIIEDSAQEETEIRAEQVQQIIDFAIQAVQGVSGIISGINDLANAKDQERVASMRDALEQAKESGSITEKEAIARAKKIDAEERKIKKQAAERDKQLALFNAVISTAAGIAKAIPNPVLIAFAAAIGAAQIALIAARPIPKFYRGKKKGDNYEGFASVGEFAPELIERNGKMMLANKPTITWVGKKDIVYNPQETAAMLGKNGHRVNKELMMIKDKGGKFVFDYKKLGKEISKNSRDVTINVDADGIHTQEGMNKINYFNSRYTFK